MTKPLRVAVTGKAVGFGMFETLEILGQQRCLARIEISAREDAVADALEQTIGLVATEVEEGLRHDGPHRRVRAARR